MSAAMMRPRVAGDSGASSPDHMTDNRFDRPASGTPLPPVAAVATAARFVAARLGLSPGHDPSTIWDVGCALRRVDDRK